MMGIKRTERIKRAIKINRLINRSVVVVIVFVHLVIGRRGVENHTGSQMMVLRAPIASVNARLARIHVVGHGRRRRHGRRWWQNRCDVRRRHCHRRSAVLRVFRFGPGTVEPEHPVFLRSGRAFGRRLRVFRGGLHRCVRRHRIGTSRGGCIRRLG